MLEPTPPNPIVVCWRGPESDPATRLGLLLAQTLGQPLILATAYDYEPAALTASITVGEFNERRRDQAEAAVRLVQQETASQLDTRLEVLPAIDASTALGDLARSVDASVVVLGRDRADHHVALAVGRDGPCAVGVAPGDTAPGGLLELGHIGVAFDDSDSSRDAVRFARHLAAHAGGRVTLFSVGGEFSPWIESVESGGALGVDTEPVVLEGGVAESLRAAAGDLDLLLCGTHGRGRVKAALLGSVSAQLITACPCPLVVVPSNVQA